MADAAPQVKNLHSQSKRRYTLYTALLAAAMMLGLYLALGVWPFGDGTVINGDLGGIYLNFYAHFKRALAGQAGFAYGFDKGLGGNLVGLFAYYCASPYNLLYSLVPVRWFPVMASVVLLVKVVASCVTFRLYITGRVPHLGWRSVALALCYGFMAYAIAYAQNPMWHDGLIMLPLVCLGIDRLAQGKPLTVYAVSLAVLIISDFYIAFMVCIFAVLYFAWALLAPAARPAGWKAPLARFAAGSALAGGCAAALLVPALANINQNKGDLLSLDFSLSTNFSLLRLPERLVWGSFAPDDMSGSLPFLYCGALALVLAVCYFAARAIPLREKLCSAGLLAALVLSFWITGLDTIWHGLKVPVWFPARYSFVFCFFVLALGGRALAARAVGKRTLLLAGGGLVVALGVMTLFPIAVSRSRLLVNVGLVVGYVFLLMLYAMTTSYVRRRFITGMLAFAVAAELLANAFFITRQFDQYALSDFQHFVDGAGGTVAAIDAADLKEKQYYDNYRIADGWLRTLNDPMLLGYRGMSHFASTQDGPAQRVLYNLGYRNYSGGGPYLSGGTAFADSVLGLRYLGSDGSRAAPAHWQQVFLEGTLQGYTTYQNPTAMPMLFTIPTAAPADVGAYEEDLFAYQNDFARLLGAQEELFTPAENVRFTDEDGAALADFTQLPTESRFEVTAEEDGWYYAYFVAENWQLVTLLVNGNASAPYFSPDYAGVIDLGWLDKGETATLQFLLHEDLEVETAAFMRLDADALQALSDAAAQNAGWFIVKDGQVDGNIMAAEGRQTLYTSIPWDENWRATVNGDPAQPFVVAGGLLALPLAAGENIIELTFTPAGQGAGLGLSIASLALLAGAVTAEALLRKRKQPIKKE